MVGDGLDCSFVIACRDDSNRDYIDQALLPSGVDIISDAESLLPQHPVLLIRAYDNVQMIMEPKTARAMAQWLLLAADWLEGALEGESS